MDEIAQRVEWWGRERFTNRTMTITGIDEKDGHTHIDKETIRVSDNEIVCDLCNRDITEFPCAVVGSNAVCRECQKGVYHVEEGDDEYFETMAYNVGMEPPDPRANFGGRRRDA